MTGCMFMAYLVKQLPKQNFRISFFLVNCASAKSTNVSLPFMIFFCCSNNVAVAISGW